MLGMAEILVRDCCCSFQHMLLQLSLHMYRQGVITNANCKWDEQNVQQVNK